MAQKNFQSAPKPNAAKPLGDKAIDSYVNGGVGNDNPQTHKPTNVGNSVLKLKRLSVDIPEQSHLRFKTACSATSRKMAGEIEAFITRRITELEKEAGISQ